MQSASTIRSCSTGLMVLTVLSSIIIGILMLFSGDGAKIILGLVIMVAGIFSGVMINALFNGFADIIDNTYAVALKVNGIDVFPSVDKETRDISFQYKTKTVEEKVEYLNELIEKGVISKEEHDKSSWTPKE